MYDFKKIEAKWQKKWQKEKTYEVEENSKKPKYFVLEQFPYPMGYDSLGLPAENAAINEGTHPKKYTENSIRNFIKQQKRLGLSYDWSRLIRTHDPEFYKWDQWIFLEMFKK